MRNLALVSLVLAACGAVTTEDAPAVDAGPDARVTPDAGPGEMSLRIVDIHRAPVVGARAVFTSAGGGFLFTASGDAEGRITATVEPHTVVHVFYEEEISPGFTVRNLVSFVDVSPGDQLAVGHTTPVIDDRLAGRMMLDPSDSAVPPGATRFVLNLGCDSFPVDLLPAFHEISRACIGADGRLTVLAEAYDDAGTLLGRAMRRNVPFVDGGNVDLPPWESPGPGVEISARLPEAASTPDLRLGAYAHGVRLEDVVIGATLDGERVSFDAPITRGYAERYEAGLVMQRPADADHNVNELHWTRRGPMAELEAGLDVDLGGRVPRLGQVSFDGAFHFTVSGEVDQADALFFWLEWRELDGEGNWYVIAPPDTPSPLRLSLHDLAAHGPPDNLPEWGEMWIHDLAGREGDYTYFKQVLGAWEMSSARVSALAEIDLLSIEVDLL